MSDPVLIDPYELAALLASAEPPLLLDVRWQLGGPPGEQEFLAGHIPGALYVDLERELSGPPVVDRVPDPSGVGGRHPLPDPASFEEAMRRVGLQPGMLVVAYDAANSQAAARLWWLLTDAGHTRVRVLDGGLAAWVAAGRPVAEGRAVPAARGSFVANPGQRARASAEDLLKPVPGRVVVDVRATERYAGETEPVDPVAGHIPGAVSLPTTGNTDPRGLFRPAAEIADRFAGVGVTGSTADTVLYCGSGVTASHALLALETAGLRGRIYPGSWSEWITDPDRPVAVGREP